MKLLCCKWAWNVGWLWQKHHSGAPFYISQRPTPSVSETLEGASVEWSTFIGIFETLEKMSPKSLKMQGNKLKIV